MIKRYQNVDVIRAVTTILIVIYHFWGIIDKAQNTGNEIFDMFLGLSGEIGVTCFFILSGFGIYCSLNKQYINKNINYSEHLVKRAKRILPQYYFSIIIVLLLMDGAYILTFSGLSNVVTHFLMIYNFFPNHFGAINGVLWTIGVIFQFYIVSIPLFKGIMKYKFAFLVSTVAFTILTKGIIYKFILPEIDPERLYAFFIGRQLFTALDNFVIGMFIAYLLIDRKVQLKTHTCLLNIVISVISLYLTMKIGYSYGIHTNNLSGYSWHSILAIVIGLFIFSFTNLKFSSNNIIIKSFCWVAKYEYGIYLWHYVLAYNIVQKSEILTRIINSDFRLLSYVILLIIVIAFGYLCSVFIDDSVFVNKLFIKIENRVGIKSKINMSNN